LELDKYAIASFNKIGQLKAIALAVSTTRERSPTTTHKVGGFSYDTNVTTQSNDSQPDLPKLMGLKPRSSLDGFLV